jgi:mutator protein MutT
MTNGQAFLMIQRARGVPKGGCWCFPGGHVEPGETSRQAIQREFAEELGIEVLPVERLGSVRVVGPRLYILAVWLVRHVGGELRLAQDEIDEARWLTASEARLVRPNLPSNERVFEMLGV